VRFKRYLYGNDAIYDSSNNQIDNYNNLPRISHVASRIYLW